MQLVCNWYATGRAATPAPRAGPETHPGDTSQLPDRDASTMFGLGLEPQICDLDFHSQDLEFQTEGPGSSKRQQLFVEDSTPQL